MNFLLTQSEIKEAYLSRTRGPPGILLSIMYVKVPFLFYKSMVTRRGKMDWEWRRGEKADQGANASQGWVIGITGRWFHCCLVFGRFWVLLLFLLAPRKLLHHTHIQTLPTHAHMQALGTPPEAGAEKWAKKGIHSLWAELFNLWLIIIWPHKGRG